MHVVRIQEPVYEDLPSTKKKLKQRNVVIASTPIRQPISSPQQQGSGALTPFSQLLHTPVQTSPAPQALPLPLLPFHRAFQTDGWRIAINTPEDRYSGRHIVTSIYALLWLKSQDHILNYSSDRHWLQKVRHMMQMRNAGSLAGPHARSSTNDLPPFSEEAEFSLAHALHLPHTIIYTEDRADKPSEEKFQLSNFPPHVWQRDPASVNEYDVVNASPNELLPFEDCDITPSVWYFSRHAFQGQNEILRKNKPRNKQEHLDMLRKVFLKDRSSSTMSNAAAPASNNRPASAKPKPLAKQSTGNRPGTAFTRSFDKETTLPPASPSAKSTQSTTTGESPLKSKVVSLTKPVKKELPPPPAPLAELAKWSEVSHKDVSNDSRVSGMGASQSLVLSKVDVVAQYTSLDRDRATHVAFLARKDLEQFLERATSTSAEDATFDGNTATSSTPLRPTSSASRPSSATLTPQQRKDRMRQSLYTNLYNDMDLVPPSLPIPAAVNAATISSSAVVAIGTKPRPSSSKGGFDPLSLHPSKVPSRTALRERRIVGLLQEFIQPPGEHAEILRVEWREELLPAYANKIKEVSALKQIVKERAKAIKMRKAAQKKQQKQRHHQHPIIHGGLPDLNSSSISEGAFDDDAEAEEEERIAYDLAYENYADARAELQEMDERRTVCYISRRLNANPLRTGDANELSLYERVCCFGYSDASPPVIDSTVMNGVLYTRLSYVVDILAQHIQVISQKNLAPQEMSLFFQIDGAHNLYLLWCDKLIYWHEKALIDGPEFTPQVLRDLENEVEEKQQSDLARLVAQQDADTSALVATMVEQEEEEEWKYHEGVPEEEEERDPALSYRIDWSSFDFDSFPSPSPMSAMISEALQGRYFKWGDQIAALNTQSLKEDAVEEEEAQGSTSRSNQPSTSRKSHTRPVSAVTVASLNGNSRPGTSSNAARTRPATAITSRSIHSLDSHDEEDDEEHEPEQPVMVLSMESAIPETEPVSEQQPTEEEDNSSPDSTGSKTALTVVVSEEKGDLADDDTSDSESMSVVTSPLGGDPVDSLAAMLSPKKESKSEWADEILFEFARKRQQERNQYRRQEEAYLEERAARQATLFGKAPATETAPGGIKALMPVGGGRQKGINLLSGAVASPLLGAMSKRELTSPAAFLLAKQQKLYGTSVSVSGAKNIRGQLANSNGTELQPAARKSGWESRAVGDLKKARMAEMAKSMPMSHFTGTGHTPPKNKNTASASPAEGEQDMNFQAHVRAQFEEPGPSRPLRSSHSLSALGAAVHSSNLRSLSHSASNSSFAPPKKTNSLALGAEGEEVADEGADQEDLTFMTSAPLSPRSLTAQARARAPLAAAAAQLTVSDAPEPPSVPNGYFTCPKCRLSLQIHAVHSTLIVDVLGEYGRMCQFMKQHQLAFSESLANTQSHKGDLTRPLSAKLGHQVPRPNSSVLNEYMDLNMYKEDAIPPAIAFVFPDMNYEAYVHYREDPSFLRSTIDLCEDCHNLVKVPLVPGSSDEVETVAPLLLPSTEAFINPATEVKKSGLGHSSTMHRQSYRNLDEEVENRAFQMQKVEMQLEKAYRAPGDVDPYAAAANFIPNEIRRLNQSTIDLLAKIPHNELEIAEHERKLEEQAIKSASGLSAAERAAAIQRVMTQYAERKAKQAEANGHITDTTPLNYQRRATQLDLLKKAGVPQLADQAPPVALMRPRPSSALTATPNPFMRPRPNTAALPRSTSSKTIRTPSSRTVTLLPPSKNSLNTSLNRVAREQKERVESEDGELAAQPSLLMSRYDVAVAGRLSSPNESPSKGTGVLTQTVRRRAQTEQLIDAIVLTSEQKRQSMLQEKEDEARFGRVSFEKKFSLRRTAASNFAPLYHQLTTSKRLGPTVDHVYVDIQSRHSAQPPPTITTSKHVDREAMLRSGSPTRNQMLHPTTVSTPPTSNAQPTAAAFRELSMAYSVVTPSPYTPNVITVRHNKGHIQPFEHKHAHLM